MVVLDAYTAVATRNSLSLARSAVLALSAVMALAGGRTACADTYVDAWGLSTSGQCNTPVFPLENPVAAIAGGSEHTIALTSNGTVVCWGYNYWGQCNPPAGLASVTQIAGGSEHTIALKSDGTIACWG